MIISTFSIMETNLIYDHVSVIDNIIKFNEEYMKVSKLYIASDFSWITRERMSDKTVLPKTFHNVWKFYKYPTKDYNLSYPT